jgi:thiamine-phosphate pyrophosphorylase
MLDYAGVGGVYATTSKDNPNAPIGVAGLRDIVAAFRARRHDFPIVGIAGIDATNAAPVIAAGADGVAVISSLSMQDNPEAAARVLRGIVDQALAQRVSR